MVNTLGNCDARVVAMAIDTDGTIGITHHHSHGCPGYVAGVEFANTSLRLVETVRDLIDGDKKVNSRSVQNLNCKDAYYVKWSALFDVYNILTQIRPYLIRKREVADVVIKFCETRMKKLEKFYHAPFDLEEQIYYEQAKELNRKGDRRFFRWLRQRGTPALL